MATTTNYSWTTPDDTDLVKDGAAAIRTLGSSADTTVKNLNPGTTAGDIDYYTSSTAKARIALGTAGQVLKVNSGATAPEWASEVFGYTLLSTTTLSGATTTISVNPTGYVELLILAQDISVTANGPMPTMQINSDTTASNYKNVWNGLSGPNAASGIGDGTYAGVNLGLPNVNGYATGSTGNMWRINIPMPTVANRKIITATVVYETDSSVPGVINEICGALNTSAISTLDFKSNTSTWSGGTIRIYGVK